MKLHSLTISAFGPFPGTSVVDFDELNDAGVFLVTGPTGAGKTSILDAVCFALFGQVPGGRGVKALRSDHAAPDARPEVVLDFSIDGRRFVVRRTPEWSRPKRRGSGTTAEKAAASVLETTDGSERLLSSRAQEVGHFLSDLLGMSASQFQQVAMLPQGEFQTFLRASSQERHDVLQQLFRTERFARIEDWVHEHSRRLRVAASGGEAAVRRLVDTMADRAGVETPEDLDAERLAQSASAGRVLPWADDLVASAQAEAGAATQIRTASEQLLDQRREELDDAELRAARSAQRFEARRVLAALADADQVDQARALLEADQRAALCLPVLALLDETLEAVASARAAHAAAAAETPGVDDAFAATKQVTAQLAKLEALLPRERELRKTREGARVAAQALAALSPQLTETQTALASLPERRARVAQELTEAERQAATRTAAEASWREALERAQAAEALVDAEQQLLVSDERARQTRDDYADAREHMLGVIARRLEGMAAELAGTLAEGEPCQVCGSTRHPSPAEPAAEAVDEAVQLAATAETDALRTVADAARSRAHEAKVAVETLRQRAGGVTAADAVETRDRCAAEVEAALAAAEQGIVLAAELAAMDTERDRLQLTLRTLEAEAARVATTAEGLGTAAEALDAEIAAELGTQSTIADAVASLKQRAELLQALADAATRLATEQGEVERRTRTAQRAIADHGFASVDEARAAALGPTTRTELAQVVSEHDEARRRAEAVLTDLPDEPEQPEADNLDAIRAALDAAAVESTQAARDSHLRSAVAEALVGQRQRLGDVMTAWSPSRERFLTAESMSRLVRGMGADNQLQLRLSSYVLATRLDQVIAAANERLTHMREQRYLLERTGEASRRGSQAGLGLRVVDEWTGETRDPASLSGGETFVVSLALALGLSDVVSTESGGVRIETLFIDEGFGMLDLDTLDDVMDRLDGLRAGGRTVGVVSHVTELRNRIPTQLHVDKQRNGSSMSVTTLIA